MYYSRLDVLDDGGWVKCFHGVHDLRTVFDGDVVESDMHLVDENQSVANFLVVLHAISHKVRVVLEQ